MELTQVEKAWLFILFNEGYRYLARDKDGSLYAYRFEPKLVNDYWVGGDECSCDKQKDELFSSIVLSGDTTPYKIVCNAPLDYYDLEEV